MPAKLDWDLFIAHASPDKSAAEKLHELLSPHARVFVDSKSLELGDDWDQGIRRAQQRALISVVLISAQSDNAYYQREEIAAAIALAREDGKRHRVVPVYLDETAKNQESLPYGLRLKHGLIAAEVGGLPGVAQQLLLTLDRVLKRPADDDGDGGDRPERQDPPVRHGPPVFETPTDPPWGPPNLGHTPLPPGQPRFVFQCSFMGDPVSYFITSQDEIVAMPPGMPPVPVGRKIPLTWPGFVWMYQTGTGSYGVDAQGRIWNRWPNGVPFQVGQAYTMPTQ